MKLSLKAIKHSEFASQETHCYEAKVYVNGKPWAIVGNDGYGGCDMQHRDPRCTSEKYEEINKEVIAYFKSLPKEPEHGLSQDLELWCSAEVNNWLAAKELKRLLKKIVGIKDGSIYTFKAKVCEESAHKIAKNGYTVLNFIDFDQALTLFKENA